ncbi:MAG: anion permease, partial [Chitinophagaceae bacterium]|nr:anion permease [Chitinophagaceae bacterium]
MYKTLSKQVVAIICVTIAVAFFLINPFQVNTAANKVIAIAVLMISLWVTEAMPMPAVALLPIVLFPLFKIAPIDTTASSYANPVIFLFMGGFMLGLAIKKWNLHRRIALNIVRITGTSGDRIVLGFIIATGLISMWLSNTATTMMMFPIAMSVIQVIKENHASQKGFTNFSLSVMIAIALASNFGGIATIIGTPPNVAYAAFINKKYDYTIQFVDWMTICMPLSIFLLIALYLVMVKWLYPNGMKSDETTKQFIRNEITQLGKVSRAEKRVLIVFLFTAGLWITKDLINELNLIRLDDNMIAIIGAT